MACLREGRDYQCVFYGGALLAQVQFASPEDEAAKLANLFQDQSQPHRRVRRRSNCQEF